MAHTYKARTPDPGPGEWTRPPAPYDHLVGIRAYSPEWGYGWLSYSREEQSDQTEIWFISDDAPPPDQFLFIIEEDGHSVQIRHDLIYRVLSEGNTWLLFHRWEPDHTFTFLLHPIEMARRHAMPALVRRMLSA